jgi:hypothetical protein
MSLAITLAGTLCLCLVIVASCSSVDWYTDPYNGHYAHSAEDDADMINQIQEDLSGKDLKQGSGVAIGYGHRISLNVEIRYASNRELVYGGPVESIYRTYAYGEYGSYTKDFDAFSVFPFGLYGMRVGGHRQFRIPHSCNPNAATKQTSCQLFSSEEAGKVVEVRTNESLLVEVSFYSSCTPIEFSFLYIRKSLGCFPDSLEGPKPLSSWFEPNNDIKHGSLVRPLMELARLTLIRMIHT